MSELTVNMSDPRVRAMLSSDGASPAAPVVQLAGDPQTGLTSTHYLTRGKQEVVVIFRDLFMTLDVYSIPGEPVRVHLICPRCHKASSISAARKAIDYDPLAQNPQSRRLLASGQPDLARSLLGQISIEPFECTWEIGDDKAAKGLHTGASLCRQRLVIDNNLAKEP